MGQWTQQQLTSGFATEPSNFAPAITASELGVDVFYAQATDGYPLGHLWVDAAGDTDWKYETLIDASNSDPVFSPPAALTRDNGIDVFVVCGGDGPAAMCWLRWPGNGGWLAPTPLPMAPQAFSGPAATSWNGTGRLDVFATVAPYTGGLEGKLVHWWLDLPINQATWASEILDSDGLVDQPCVTSWGAEHLDV
ncbi:MAG TPA: hypothetical protein VES65_10580, partial [Solirubrobacteraceae bacterium]|nr:hypothetical protein [Solirubrobacteraceae bacterium]